MKPHSPLLAFSDHWIKLKEEKAFHFKYLDSMFYSDFKVWVQYKFDTDE